MVVWLVVMTAAHAVEARAQDPWDAAEQRIRRLPPDSFPGLPERVREAMDRLSCAVPQGSDLHVLEALKERARAMGGDAVIGLSEGAEVAGGGEDVTSAPVLSGTVIRFREEDCTR